MEMLLPRCSDDEAGIQLVAPWTIIIGFGLSVATARFLLDRINSLDMAIQSNTTAIHHARGA
jgi:hypothetical protein